MNKKIKNLLLLCCIAVIAMAFYYPAFRKYFKQPPFKFYIFQTSDTHGYLNNVEDECSGDWLRLGNILKKEIDKAGGHDNCLLIDCGDTFQGTIEASEEKGKFIVSIMNNLEYDIFVPGNHDFDFGFNNFLDRINGLNADVIAANLILEPTHLPKLTHKILPWKLYIKNNIKIAVIGMTSPYLKYWLWGKEHEKYNVFSISKTLQKIMPGILETNPDIIILAFHHGLYNSKRFPGKDNFLKSIIKKYPQINIVFGGHTHQIYPGESLYNSSVYVQPGAHAEYFSKLEVEVDKTGKTLPLIKTELIPILPTDSPNKQLADIASETIRKSNLKRREIVGKTNTVIDDKGIPGINNRMSELFANAVLRLVKADAVMATVIKAGYELNGVITYGDIFNICPYEDTIAILSLNYVELRKILEEQDAHKDKYRKNLGLYIVDSKSNKNRLLPSLDSHNLLPFFNEKDRINVAFSSYDVAGAGSRYPVLRKIAQRANAQAFDTQILLRDAVLKYIQDSSLKEK
jgi:2',3'-cyclic-nucleotide 2'-phosphodiesterase (5'-nucleotidase family)